MPSSFDTEFAAGALPDLLAVHGRQVTYTTAAGSASTIYGRFHENVSTTRDDTDGREVLRTATIRIGNDAALATYGGVASPAVDDTVTVDGDIWHVSNTGEPNGGQWTLELERIEAVEKTQPGYRDEA